MTEKCTVMQLILLKWRIVRSFAENKLEFQTLDN